MDDPRDADPVLKAVCYHWQQKVALARDHKRRVFQADADECLRFYDGPRDWDRMMGGRLGLVQGEVVPSPLFKMSVNKAFELVTIFGPYLYSQNPVRTVSPRLPLDVPPEFFPDAYTYQATAIQEQQRLGLDGFRAAMLERYLNWTPGENRLDRASRRAIEEGLIKGRGCLWTELATPPGTTWRVVSTTFESVDDLLVDPDAVSLETATWVARRCVHPVWQVERDYGITPGTLKGNLESQAVQSEVADDEDALYERRRGRTNDLLTYWKIYSKMGIGGRLSGINPRFRGPLEVFGDFVFLVIADSVPFPLNLPPSVQQQAGFGGDPKPVLARVAWPTPFWALRGAWPVSCLDFHAIPNSPWPLAHLKAGLGELKFLNWAMSFLAGKVRNTSRDFIAAIKEAGEDLKTAVLQGTDLTLLEIDAQHRTIQEVIGFLQHPPMNKDIWEVIAAVQENFDKRVGLTELMYGAAGATQIRSAQEAQIRSSNMNVRPDDMARVVEAWMSEVAAKEAICARYHLGAADVSLVVGELAAGYWDRLVATRELDQVTRQLDYAIEAGSARRPNKDTQVSDSNEGMQVLGPILQGYAQTTGDVGPLNALVADWARARDLDPNRYQMQALPPPAPASPAPGVPQEEPATPATGG